MNEEQAFQLWLLVLSLAMGAYGVMQWYFARKVMDIPTKYATKDELEKASDGWNNEVRQMRNERREDARDIQTKFDKIETTIESSIRGVHQRLDNFLRPTKPV